MCGDQLLADLEVRGDFTQCAVEGGDREDRHGAGDEHAHPAQGAADGDGNDDENVEDCRLGEVAQEQLRAAHDRVPEAQVAVDDEEHPEHGQGAHDDRADPGECEQPVRDADDEPVEEHLADVVELEEVADRHRAGVVRFESGVREPCLGKHPKHDHDEHEEEDPDEAEAAEREHHTLATGAPPERGQENYAEHQRVDEDEGESPQEHPDEEGTDVLREELPAPLEGVDPWGVRTSSTLWRGRRRGLPTVLPARGWGVAATRRWSVPSRGGRRRRRLPARGRWRRRGLATRWGRGRWWRGLATRLRRHVLRRHAAWVLPGRWLPRLPVRVLWILRTRALGHFISPCCC